MVDLVITAASVVAGTTAGTIPGIAGATITAGNVLYLDGTDGRYKLADADSATTAVRQPSGIALHAASAGQPLRVLTDGPVTIGAALTGGTAYYLSKTAGGIAPIADITGVGTYPTIIGVATSATVLDVKFHQSGVSL